MSPSEIEQLKEAIASNHVVLYKGSSLLRVYGFDKYKDTGKEYALAGVGQHVDVNLENVGTERFVKLTPLFDKDLTYLRGRTMAPSSAEPLPTDIQGADGLGRVVPLYLHGNKLVVRHPDGHWLPVRDATLEEVKAYERQAVN